MTAPGVYWLACEPPSPPLVLRRTVDDHGLRDEAWIGGQWRSTSLIAQWSVGRENDIDVVSEATARALMGRVSA